MVIIETEIPEKNTLARLWVTKKENEKYDVIVNSFIRHADCTAEDVMRALANYMTSMAYIIRLPETEKTEK